jgi:hypothetical protein
VDGLLGQLGGVLGRHHHVGRVGQHDDLLGGDVVDAGQQLVRGRVERVAAVERDGADALEQLAHPGPRDDREHPARLHRLGEALAALVDLLGHVRHVEVRDLAGTGEQGGRALGLVGVEVDLDGVAVADDQHGVAEPLQRLVPRARVQPLAGDREVRAEAEGHRLVLRMGDARRGVVGQRRGVGAAQRGDHAGEHHGQAVAAGVDHAGLAQHRQQLWSAGDRQLA